MSSLWYWKVIDIRIHYLAVTSSQIIDFLSCTFHEPRALLKSNDTYKKAYKMNQVLSWISYIALCKLHKYLGIPRSNSWHAWIFRHVLRYIKNNTFAKGPHARDLVLREMNRMVRNFVLVPGTDCFFFRPSCWSGKLLKTLGYRETYRMKYGHNREIRNRNVYEQEMYYSSYVHSNLL